MSVAFERVGVDDAPWVELAAHPDRSVFATRGWLRFLERTQRAEPVVAAVLEDRQVVGWFTGATVRRAGLRILGSPLPGWTTSYMGFALDRPELRGAVAAALPAFAFGELRCVHVELMDRGLADADGEVPTGATRSTFHSFEAALRDDDTMLAAMSQMARRNIRRAAASGVVVEAVDPELAGEFAERYHRQVSAAFAKRGLAPTYDVGRVRAAIDCLAEGAHLVLLQARAPGGEVAATGIFPGLPGASAFFWMGASDPTLVHLRPNEAVMWAAMQRWRDRGGARLDLGGGGTFKAKFGAEAVEVPWLRWSRWPVLDTGRRLVSGAARGHQRIRHRLTR